MNEIHLRNISNELKNRLINNQKKLGYKNLQDYLLEILEVESYKHNLSDLVFQLKNEIAIVIEQIETGNEIIKYLLVELIAERGELDEDRD